METASVKILENQKVVMKRQIEAYKKQEENARYSLAESLDRIAVLESNIIEIEKSIDIILRYS